jgi:hypothetical protein
MRLGHIPTVLEMLQLYHDLYDRRPHLEAGGMAIKPCKVTRCDEPAGVHWGSMKLDHITSIRFYKFRGCGFLSAFFWIKMGMRYNFLLTRDACRRRNTAAILRG